jgi:hypothetical protein
MTSRRSFVLGACCLFQAWPALAVPRPRTFICATADVDGAPAASAGRAGLAKGGHVRRRATLDRPSLWTQKDGATPGTGTITLDVHFMNGTRGERDLVRRVAPEWTAGRLGKRIQFRFDAPRKGSHVRVLFRGGHGNVSEVGRKSLAVPENRHTMNLDDINRRGILHEFGHVLGLRHEHQNPNSGIVWNEPVVIAALKAMGWSKQKVEENIFERFSQDCTCAGDPTADPQSVMMYPIPKEWTLNGFSSDLNWNISKRDRACLVREYRV